MHTDAAVVALARDGDSDAFRTLVERHGHGVFRLAYRMTVTAQAAEDVLQEAFLKGVPAAQPFRVTCEFQYLAAPDRRQLLDRSDSIPSAS